MSGGQSIVRSSKADRGARLMELDKRDFAPSPKVFRFNRKYKIYSIIDLCFLYVEFNCESYVDIECLVTFHLIIKSYCLQIKSTIILYTFHSNEYSMTRLCFQNFIKN